MQKVIQQTKRAERVAARQFEKNKWHKERGEASGRAQQRKASMQETWKNIREDRINRRVDWESGRLAPRRDVGEHAKFYGTAPAHSATLADVEPALRPKWMPIQPGDRVVIISGRDQGKIGVVARTGVDNASVTVRDLNMIDTRVPGWMQAGESAEDSLVSFPADIRLKDVRLVHPLRDPTTGVPRDVIIDRLMCVNRRWDKNKKKWDDGDRVIPGTNTVIPWPEKADPEYEDNGSDTLRISVEEQTFRPFLIGPPMPLSVIDELRNKYSRFRTRHDHDYIMKKEAEDAKAESRKTLVQKMRTPLQELAEMHARQKAAEERELTNEQLARIGEVIERERQKANSAMTALPTTQ